MSTGALPSKISSKSPVKEFPAITTTDPVQAQIEALQQQIAQLEESLRAEIRDYNQSQRELAHDPVYPSWDIWDKGMAKGDDMIGYYKDQILQAKNQIFNLQNPNTSLGSLSIDGRDIHLSI